MLLRRLLILSHNYDLVYEWYPAFKNPHGEDVDRSLKGYIQSVRAGALAYRWIHGYESVVECGCGAAAVGLELAQYNNKWIASDVVRPPALERLIGIFLPGPAFEFTIMDGITLDQCENESVQAVLSRSYFEHLLPEDALTHLDSVYRVLKPGGEVILSCPAGVGPPSDITNRFPQYKTARGLHMKEYRIAEMNRIMEERGFFHIRSRFIRSGILCKLPGLFQKMNVLDMNTAHVIETLAAVTWPLFRSSALTRTIWKKCWGYLGATSIYVIGRKPSHEIPGKMI
jgi:predicted SAM-dependent methyltransferase